MSRPTRTAVAARWCSMWVSAAGGYRIQPAVSLLKFVTQTTGTNPSLLSTGHSISLNCILATKRDDQFPQSLRDRRQLSNRRNRSDSLGCSVLGIQYDILHPPPRCLLVEANTLSRRWKVESDTTSFSPGG